jgi:hypothetical protein
MNSNTDQYLAGMAYVAKLQEDSQPETPFAVFDNLTPDEPGRAQQLIQHVLEGAGHAVTMRVFKYHQTFPRQTSNPLHGDGQTVAALE